MRIPKRTILGDMPCVNCGKEGTKSNGLCDCCQNLQSRGKLPNPPAPTMCVSCNKRPAKFKATLMCGRCNRWEEGTLKQQQPHYHRRFNLRKFYGIAPEQYDEMLTLQEGKCGLCKEFPKGQRPRLHTDHCHITNKIRRLLCADCNTAVGLMRENSSLIAKMAVYVDYFRESSDPAEYVSPTDFQQIHADFTKELDALECKFKVILQTRTNIQPKYINRKQ